jgi:hypothetical protein
MFVAVLFFLDAAVNGWVNAGNVPRSKNRYN